MNEQVKDKKMTPWQVLRNKFPENEYVLIAEVSDASGFSRSRSLDYMIINLWESRGLAITGIERKTNRSDWLKELNNPKKQENHFKHCDYFYLLTDKDGVAKLEEIPVSWGWYHINEKGVLKTLKAAPKLNPEPVTRSFMCAMMKRAASKEKYVHISSIEDKLQEARDSQDSYNKREMYRLKDDYDKLLKQVKAFENAAGIEIYDKWSYRAPPEKVGAAVKYILRNDGIDFKKDLELTKQKAERVAQEISNVVAGL